MADLEITVCHISLVDVLQCTGQLPTYPGGSLLSVFALPSQKVRAVRHGVVYYL